MAKTKPLPIAVFSFLICSVALSGWFQAIFLVPSQFSSEVNILRQNAQGSSTYQVEHEIRETPREVRENNPEFYGTPPDLRLEVEAKVRPAPRRVQTKSKESQALHDEGINQKIQAISPLTPINGPLKIEAKAPNASQFYDVPHSPADLVVKPESLGVQNDMRLKPKAPAFHQKQQTQSKDTKTSFKSLVSVGEAAEQLKLRHNISKTTSESNLSLSPKAPGFQQNTQEKPMAKNHGDEKQKPVRVEGTNQEEKTLESSVDEVEKEEDEDDESLHEEEYEKHDGQGETEQGDDGGADIDTHEGADGVDTEGQEGVHGTDTEDQEGGDGVGTEELIGDDQEQAEADDKANLTLHEPSLLTISHYRNALQNTHLPILTQEDFPGSYKFCPHWRSLKHHEKILMNDSFQHWDTLFKDSKRFHDLTSGKSCAMVGSSGILRSSSFGQEISDHDTVIRFGLATIRNKTMAGNRTDILWINPSTAGRITALKMRIHKPKLIMVSALQAEHYWKIRAIKKRIPPGLDVEVGPLNCIFFRGARHLTRASVKKVPSAGLQSVIWGLRFCKKVDIYGIWPFAEDCQGEKVTYHYFDKWTPNSNTHDARQEIEFYQDLMRHADALGIKFKVHLPENAKCAADPTTVYGNEPKRARRRNRK